MKPRPVKGKHGGARAGAGQPPYQPTESDRSTVMVMAGCGKTQEQIARVIGPRGIAEDTLRKHFAHELSVGRDRLDGICTTGIAKAMQNGEAWALCFYAKTRMGWREKSDILVAGSLDVHDSSKQHLAAAIDSLVAGMAAQTVSREPDRG